MECDIEELLSHIQDMANEAIDLEDFQSSLEEFASDLELALEEDDHKRGLSTGAKIGIGAGIVGAGIVGTGMHFASYIRTVSRIERFDPHFVEWLASVVNTSNLHALKPEEARKYADKIDKRAEFLYKKGHINERDCKRLKKISKDIVKTAAKSFR